MKRGTFYKTELGNNIVKLMTRSTAETSQNILGEMSAKYYVDLPKEKEKPHPY